MTMIQQYETLAAILTCAGLYLISTEVLIIGWWIALLSNLLWIAVGVKVSLYAMACLNAVLGLIAINALLSL